MSEFTCYRCNKTFEKMNNEEWNDYKAAQEFLTLYPECGNDQTNLLCEDCNELFKIWFSMLSEEEKIQMRNHK